MAALQGGTDGGEGSRVWITAPSPSSSGRRSPNGIGRTHRQTYSYATANVAVVVGVGARLVGGAQLSGWPAAP